MTGGMLSGNGLNPPSLSVMQDFVNGIEGARNGDEPEVSISFLRNFTLEGIEPYLKYYLYRSGLRPNIHFGNYDAVRQELYDDSSHIYRQKADIIVIALMLDNYLSGPSSVDFDPEYVKNDLESIFSLAAAETGSIIAINCFIPPFHAGHGITNSPETRDFLFEVADLNQFIRAFVKKHPSRFVLMDWERMVRLAGEAESMDYRFWYMSRAPFKKGFLSLYATELVKVARALKGKSKKCLVLDCDNTLWGGIIGEDGLSGIRLDRHNFPGNIYYQFQKSILSLFERGVLIALCSKNNEEDVWEVLDRHPDCLVKRSHLSAWRVNWENKVANIGSLARELNLGLESFVFVDDNPSECEIVGTMLPEVTVLQVPDRLYTYPDLLFRDGYFDTLTLSDEDRRRSEMYRDEQQRRHALARYETMDQYLASLELVATIHDARDRELARIAQLTQKTNQFNLTTRRYSEAEIAAFSENPEWALVSLSLRDKFGDSGLTGVLIARREGDRGAIDSLLLSCRILGKNVEHAFVVTALARLAQRWGVISWHAEYIPTAKNRQVSCFWEQFGFQATGDDSGRITYLLPSGSTGQEIAPYITIEE